MRLEVELVAALPAGGGFIVDDQIEPLPVEKLAFAPLSDQAADALLVSAIDFSCLFESGWRNWNAIRPFCGRSVSDLVFEGFFACHRLNVGKLGVAHGAGDPWRLLHYTFSRLPAHELEIRPRLGAAVRCRHIHRAQLHHWVGARTHPPHECDLVVEISDACVPADRVSPES
jgi:hypothetical protein